MCMGGGRESTNDFPHSLPLCSSLYQLPFTHHTHLDLLPLNLQLWPLPREQLSPMPAPYMEVALPAHSTGETQAYLFCSKPRWIQLLGGGILHLPRHPQPEDEGKDRDNLKS